MPFDLLRDGCQPLAMVFRIGQRRTFAIQGFAEHEPAVIKQPRPMLIAVGKSADESIFTPHPRLDPVFQNVAGTRIRAKKTIAVAQEQSLVNRPYDLGQRNR